MRENLLRSRMVAGRPSLLGWLSTDGTLIAESMARLGFDAIAIDLQHGAGNEAQLMSQLQAVSLGAATPIVRVTRNDPALIGRALDLGAYGVIVPMVETAVDVTRMVQACRYPPRGVRSYGPTRGGLYGGGDYARHADDTVLAIAMIETRSAIEGLDAILEVPGLDAVFVGPADLSQAYGGPAGSDWIDGPVPPLLDHVVQRCRAKGVAAGLFTRSAAYAARMVALGYLFVTIKNDVAYALEGATAALASASDWRGPP